MDPEMVALIEALAERKGTYPAAAYFWVLRSLEYTRQRHRREGHVSGRELAEGARDFALEEYGPMALTVLGHWGVHETSDIGRIVYDLIEEKVLRRSEEDSLEDFRGVYDFQAAFERDYRWA
jgi:uncharacterized repeat protein (TIGR04138 family)